MASAINFNTVWTSIFEPLPTFGFLKRLGARERVGRAPRPAVPRDGLRRVGRRAARRLGGAQLEAGRPGHRRTACTSTTRTRRAHDDSMMATNQRIWGFETNFGGLAEIAVVKANQLMPKPEHLTWEEAACNALCNSTSYRMIVSPNGSQMTQGPGGARVGRDRRHRRVRGAVRVQRRRHARRCRVVGEARRPAARAGLRGGDRPARRGLQVLERRRHRAGPDGVVAVRQEDPRADRPRRRHRVRAPGSFDDGRVGVRRQARRHDHHVRGDVGLQDRVRQPLPLDEPQDAQGLSLRELPRGVGGEPVGRRGAGSTRRCRRCTRSTRPARPRTRCTTTSSRARSACCASRPKEGLGVTDDATRAQHLDQITLFRRHATEPSARP